MILECKSCQKKFVVPDSAITNAGRLVQCSSCGNKWTQFPITKKVTKETINFSAKKEIKEKLAKAPPKIQKEKIFSTPIKKKKIAKKKSGPSIYSKEYLEKKHGIKIDSEQLLNDKKTLKANQAKISYFGFYSYLIITLIIIAISLGLLNLTKEILIFNFPFLEPFIYNLFENINNFKILLSDALNVY